MEEILERLKEIFKNLDYKKIRKIMIPFLLIILVILQFISIIILISNKNTKEESKEESIISKTENIKVEEEQDIIYVDVKGSVKTPGVYKLYSNSNVIDAVNAAGGITKDANTRYTNLSKKLKDQDVVVIYSKQEIENASKENIIYLETPCVCEEIKNDACYNDKQEETKDPIEETQTTKININTATLTELTTLTGIGEAKAQSIINYRTENGAFKTIEDIKNVAGISETIYTKIKENITV